MLQKIIFFVLVTGLDLSCAIKRTDVPTEVVPPAIAQNPIKQPISSSPKIPAKSNTVSVFFLASDNPNEQDTTDPILIDLNDAKPGQDINGLGLTNPAATIIEDLGGAETRSTLNFQNKLDLEFKTRIGKDFFDNLPFFVKKRVATQATQYPQGQIAQLKGVTVRDSTYFISFKNQFYIERNTDTGDFVKIPVAQSERGIWDRLPWNRKIYTYGVKNGEKEALNRIEIPTLAKNEFGKGSIAGFASSNKIIRFKDARGHTEVARGVRNGDKLDIYLLKRNGEVDYAKQVYTIQLVKNDRDGVSIQRLMPENFSKDDVKNLDLNLDPATVILLADQYARVIGREWNVSPALNTDGVDQVMGPSY